MAKHRSCDCISLYAHEMDISYLCAEPFRSSRDVRLHYGRVMASRIRENRENGVSGAHQACDCTFWVDHAIREQHGFPCRLPLATIRVEEKHAQVSIQRALLDDFVRMPGVLSGQTELATLTHWPFPPQRTPPTEYDQTEEEPSDG